MKICFVLNQIKTEKVGTSVIIMNKAHQKGHQVYVSEVGDFVFSNKNGLSLKCKEFPENFSGQTVEETWSKVQADSLKREIISTQEMDIVFLRNNPTEEGPGRHWAQHSALAFGRMLQKNGVLVVNDAVGMSQAFVDKLYFEELPAEIKPDSLITRNKDELLQFWERHNKEMILKPLEGSGGQDVYKIGPKKSNLQQIFDTIIKKGYVIAQEYIPEAKEGDMRVVLMNGKILQQDGEYAIIHRASTDETEFRSNLTLGGVPKPGKLTPEIEHIVSVVAPKIIRDGLFFIGLDIVKDKLIEINVLSPGGIEQYKVSGMTDFTDTIVDALERKVAYKKKHDNLPNQALATME